jgi:cytoskeletal protein RodZ
MALFRRKKDDSTLPEVEQYYEAERRDRSGLAWLLAILSMVVVAGILVLLFLGGRWAYNEITDSNEEDVATTEPSEVQSFDGAPTNEPSTNQDSEAPQSSTESNTATPADSTSTTTSTSNSSNESASNSSLPHTGPADTAAIFVSVSIAAATAHYVVQRRKLSRS